MLNLRALIVDDSAIVRAQLRNEIREVVPDCHVFEVEGVLEAGRFLLRGVPDVDIVAFANTHFELVKR